MKLTPVVLAVFSAASVVHAQSVTLTKYLDTDDSVQVPGAPAGTFFTGFDSETPSIDNGVLCFEARWDDPVTGNSIDGIYTITESGVVTRIMDEFDFDPNGASSSITLELLRDGTVSFEGNGSNSEGIWSRSADGTGPINALSSVGDVLPLASTPTIVGYSEHGRDGDWLIIEVEDNFFNEGVY